MKIRSQLICILAAAGMGLGAQAQQAAVVPDPASVTVPAATCDQPPKKPTLGATSKELDRFNKSVSAYGKCMQEYAKNQEASARAYGAIGQKYLDAGNAAIKTYNDYITAVKENTDSGDD